MTDRASTEGLPLREGHIVVTLPSGEQYYDPPIPDRASAEGLREALARAIEGGYADASIDSDLYHNDAVYHAIVWEVRKHRARKHRAALRDWTRLAEAWANVMDGRRIGSGLNAARIGRDTTTGDDWHAIAAEYAALASETSDDA